MAKNSETAKYSALAEALLQTLESQRRLGGDAYPLILRRLAELCDGSVPDDVTLKAVGTKAFTSKAAAEKVNGKLNLDGRVYFKEDKPTKAQLAALEIPGLAARLLKVLESQRRLGGDAYPLPLRRLVELCDLKASDSRIPSIVANPAAAASLIVANVVGKTKKPVLDAPAFLKEDLPQVFPALVRYALEASRTGLERTFTAKKLAGKMAPDLKPLMEKALAKDQVEHQALPSELAWVPGTKGVPTFFHVEDLRPKASQNAGSSSITPARSVTTHSPTSNGASHAPRPDFADAFHDAFRLLDQRNRSTNFVKLADLRRALSQYNRGEFDSGLNQLRDAQLYSLNSHEGLHSSLTPEEREAGLQEAGSLLIYASRR